MGLSELTDQDLRPVKGNDQPESPQLPESEKPKPIEDGAADRDEYNNLYYHGNHETIRKYWKLRDKLYGTNEDYLKFTKVNSTLFDEIDSKSIEAEKGRFQEIWEKDDANKISETKSHNETKLAKMEEVIPLMERLIAESNNNTNNDTSESEGKKRKSDEAELEINNENRKKTKTITDKIKQLLEEAENIVSYEELETKIREIDKYQGEQGYIDYQDRINQLKISLGSLDEEKFRVSRVKKIEDLMKDNKVKEDDLDQETKNELAALKNESDINKINELENKVSEKIGKKGALNTLNDWLKRAKELVEEVKKGTVKHFSEELKKVKKGLMSFQSSTNSYQKSAYENKEKDVKEALEKLENFSTQAVTPKDSFPLVPVVVIGFSVVFLIGAAILIRNRRVRKQK